MAAVLNNNKNDIPVDQELSEAEKKALLKLSLQEVLTCNKYCEMAIHSFIIELLCFTYQLIFIFLSRQRRDVQILEK